MSTRKGNPVFLLCLFMPSNKELTQVTVRNQRPTTTGNYLGYFVLFALSTPWSAVSCEARSWKHMNYCKLILGLPPCHSLMPKEPVLVKTWSKELLAIWNKQRGKDLWKWKKEFSLKKQKQKPAYLRNDVSTDITQTLILRSKCTKA